MNPFEYDFGYGWQWNYGHLIAVGVFGTFALLAWRRRWRRWVLGIALGLTLWGVGALWIVQMVLRMNLPLELPTERFFVEGKGDVLDAGAGSGRSSLMVLLARPESRIVALDLYDGYFGIEDNGPERLMENAATAGVEERVQARVGDVRAMPFEDASLHAAVSAYVIDHLSSDGVERSLSEIHRVLRPNGEFLLMVIHPDAWIRVAYPFLVHHGYFGPRTNAERWRSRLTSAGFELVEEGTTPGTLYLLARKPGQPSLDSMARAVSTKATRRAIAPSGTSTMPRPGSPS